MMPKFWQDYIDSIKRHVDKDMFTTRRLLRLRTHMYWKIPWMDTNNMVDYMLRADLLREIRYEPGWFAPPACLDMENDIIGKYYDIFEVKRNIYAAWNEASKRDSGFSEKIVRDGLVKAGFTAQRFVFDVPENFFDDGSNQRQVEIDAYCVGHGMRLGVEVKNVTSDVYFDPGIIANPNEALRQLMHRFEYCYKNHIVPILFAPLIDGSFYVYCDNTKGLFCQTFFQYFSKKYADLVESIRNELRYSHVRAVDELPEIHVKWFRKIPEMWRNRHGGWDY